MQMVLDAKNIRWAKSHAKGLHNFILPETFINDNGTKESTTFNNLTWSRATTKYIKFVNMTLQETSFGKIIEKAKGMMASMHWLYMDEAVDVKSYDDVQLVGLSDEDCKFQYISVDLH